MDIFIGTAGWTVPKQHSSLFPPPSEHLNPTHLERYAGRLRCVEINSSFYRSHRPATWQRWAATTPENFRFAVKVPKAVTHVAKLVNTGAALHEFFDSLSGLGQKLGPILVQLPPKLPFEDGLAREFFTTLRELHPGPVALEPRHPDWFDVSADRLLKSFQIARVAADPPKGSPLTKQPGGWSGLCYWRLHGVPRTYYSNYDEPWLYSFAERLRVSKQSSRCTENWVIFDNTALGNAAGNALSLQQALVQSRQLD